MKGVQRIRPSGQFEHSKPSYGHLSGMIDHKQCIFLAMVIYLGWARAGAGRWIRWVKMDGYGLSWDVSPFRWRRLAGGHSGVLAGYDG